MYKLVLFQGARSGKGLVAHIAGIMWFFRLFECFVFFALVTSVGLLSSVPLHVFVQMAKICEGFITPVTTVWLLASAVCSSIWSFRVLHYATDLLH